MLLQPSTGTYYKCGKGKYVSSISICTLNSRVHISGCFGLGVQSFTTCYNFGFRAETGLYGKDDVFGMWWAQTT
jgi:hypothetical protein